MPSQVARGRNYSNKDDLDRAFGIVESEVETSWKIVAMELGQTLDEILVFERQSWKVSDQCRRSLDWWRLMAGPKGATVPNLVQALRRCRLDWVADKIEGRSPIRVLEKKKITLKASERITPVTEDSHSLPVQPTTATLGGVQFIKEAPKLEQSPAPKREPSPSPVQRNAQEDDEDHSPTYIIVKKKSKSRKDKKRSQSEPRKSKVTISVNQEQTRPSQQPSQPTRHYTPLQRSESMHSSAPKRTHISTALLNKVISEPVSTKAREQPPKVTTHYTSLKRSETVHSSAPKRTQIGTAPPKIVVYEHVSPSEKPPKAATPNTQLRRSETIHSSAPTRTHIGTAPPKLPVAPPRTKQTRHSRFLEHSRAKPCERAIDGIKNYQRVSTRSRKKLVEGITDWTRVTIHPPETKRKQRKERASSQSAVVRIVPSTPLKTEEDDLLYWEKPSPHENYGPVIPILLREPQSSRQNGDFPQQTESQEVPDMHRSQEGIHQNGDAKATAARQTKNRETPPPVVPPRRKRRKSSSRRPSTIYTEYLNNDHETSDENTRGADEYSRRRSYRGIVLDRETDRVDEDPLQVRPSSETVRRQLRDRNVTQTTRESAVQTNKDLEKERRGRTRNVLSGREVSVDRRVEEENRQNLDMEAVQESHRYDNLLLVGGTRQTSGQHRRTVGPHEDQSFDNRLNVNQEQALEERFAKTRLLETDISVKTGEEPSPQLQLHYADILKEELIIYYPLDEFDTDSNYSASLNGDMVSETAPSEEPVFHTADVLREEMVVYIPEEEIEPTTEVQSTLRTRNDDGTPHLNAGHIFEEYVSNHSGFESVDRSTGPYIYSVNVRENSESHASQRVGRFGTDYVKMSRKASRESTGDEAQNGSIAAGSFTEIPGTTRARNSAETDDVFEDGRFTRLGVQKKAASVAREDSLRKKTVSFSEQPVVIPSSESQEEGDGENYADAMLW